MVCLSVCASADENVKRTSRPDNAMALRMCFIKLSLLSITRERPAKRAITDYAHYPCNLWMLLDQLAELAPGDEFYLVFLKQLAEGIAGEEFEIALAPGRSPVRMIESCATHFRIVIGEVNDDFSYSRLQFFDCVGIKLGPVACRHTRIDVQRAIDV